MEPIELDNFDQIGLYQSEEMELIRQNQFDGNDQMIEWIQ
jgi:hypothetical protein